MTVISLQKISISLNMQKALVRMHVIPQAKFTSANPTAHVTSKITVFQVIIIQDLFFLSFGRLQTGQKPFSDVDDFSTQLFSKFKF